MIGDAALHRFIVGICGAATACKREMAVVAHEKSVPAAVSTTIAEEDLLQAAHIGTDPDQLDFLICLTVDETLDLNVRSALGQILPKTRR